VKGPTHRRRIMGKRDFTVGQMRIAVEHERTLQNRAGRFRV
jgi:hypothetical protein